MKKITSLFCLLIVSILSYAVNEAEIKALIEANSDVKVNVINDSNNPWEIEQGDTLYNPNSSGVLTVIYESDGVIQLNIPRKEKTSFYVDGTTKNNGAFIAPGEHQLEVKSTAADAHFSGFSLRKICTNEDIQTMIEASSDIVLLELVNDENKPWGIGGRDSLCNPVSGGTITFVFETDHIVEMTYTSKASASIYVDGTNRNSGVYIPAGKHEISIKSTSSKAQVIGLSIKKLCTNEDIKNMIQAVSDVKIVEVINDSVRPWAIIGQDSLYNPTAYGTLTIVFESDKGVFWKNSYKYINYISIDTVNIDNESSFRGNYIPPGRHSFSIKSYDASKCYGLAFRKVQKENEDIKSLLQTTCGVDILEVVDASNVPWAIVGKDSLCSSQNSYLLINYYSDKVVELQATKTSSNTYIYLDGVSQNNIDYLPAGNHIIALYTNTSTPQYVTISLDKYITTEAEIEDWIEANSDLDIIEVINDPINPWILKPDGTLENSVKGSQLIVTYETENVTQLNYNSVKYVSFTIHGATKSLNSYFPNGKHTLVIKSTARYNDDTSFIKELKFSYICSCLDIEEWIEANSDVDVTEFVNDSINPWYVSDGYLCNPNNPALYITLSFSFETDHITCLNFVASNNGTSYSSDEAFSVDGITKNENSYIPSGNHKLSFKSRYKYKNLQFNSISITNICTDEDIKVWLEKESDIDIIEIQNDSVNPWIIKEQDTLYNPESGTLSFTFHSEGATQLEFTSANNDTYIYVDGERKKSGTYIPAGTHEIKISYSGEKITTFSIKEISFDADIKAMIEAYSDIEVDILNDSVAPWIALGEDTLSHPFSTTGIMKLAYETEYITQLDYLSVSEISIYLDSIHQLNKGNYLPAGKHELTIKGSSNAVIKGLSIKNVCTDADIKAMIETYSDVEVIEVINDSVHPWIVLGEDTLYGKGSTLGLMIRFKTNYNTQLDYVSAGGGCDLDGVFKSKGAYLPSGTHTLRIRYSTKGLSIKNVCTDADIEHAIEANSDVDVTIINDSIDPWVVLGGDTLYNQNRKPLTITYESDSITQVSCDNLSTICINGQTRRFPYVNIPAGKNEIIIKDKNQLTGLSIKKICSDADIKQMIEENSDVKVEIINDSISPWIIQGQDTLKPGSSLRITYEADFITQITFTNKCSFSVDGRRVSTCPSPYIPAGKHTISLFTSASGMSIKKIGTDEDIKAMLEANFDAEIIDVQNDSVWSFSAKQPNELHFWRDAILTIVLETRDVTQLTSEALPAYVDVCIDGVWIWENKNSVHLPIGKHIITLRGSGDGPVTIKGLTLKRAHTDASIEEWIKSNSNVEAEISVVNDTIAPWKISANGLASSKDADLYVLFSIKDTAILTCNANFAFINSSKKVYEDQSIYVDKATSEYLEPGNYVCRFYAGSRTIKRLSLKDPSLLPSVEEAINAVSNLKVDVYSDDTWFMADSTWIVSPIENPRRPLSPKDSSQLTIKYTSDKMTAVYLKRAPSCTIDGEKLTNRASHGFSYLPAGTHTITFKGYSIDSINVREILPFDAMHFEGRHISSSIQSYDLDNNRSIEVSTDRIMDLLHGKWQQYPKPYSTWINFNNDDYIDGVSYTTNGSDDWSILYLCDTTADDKFYSMKTQYIACMFDYNNDGYPNAFEYNVQISDNAQIYTARETNFTKANTKIYSIDRYKKLQQSTQDVSLSSKETKSANVSGPKRMIKVTSEVLSLNNYILPEMRGYSAKLRANSRPDMDIDIDGDGVIECLRFDRNLMYRGLSDGTIVYESMAGDVMDLNADGLMDMISYDDEKLAIVYFLRQPDGSYIKRSYTIGTTYNNLWCYDFDQDGDKDILLTFEYNAAYGGSYFLMLENMGNTIYKGHEYFCEAQIISPCCIDFDNDGYYEIVGRFAEVNNTDSARVAYLNVDGLSISDTPLLINRISLNDIAIYDLDNDGIMELWGSSSNNMYCIPLSATPNSKPNKPAPPTFAYASSSEELSITWKMGIDAETSPVDLTYALRIGTAPGKGDILYAHAHPDGTRKNLIGGNQSTNRLRVLNTKTWAAGKYYISIQAIDPNNRGSEFSDEVVFEKKTPTASFELHYDADAFGVGDTCSVVLYPSTLADTTHYIVPTNGKIISVSEDQLTLDVIFNQSGMQRVLLYHKNANGESYISCEKTIFVQPISYAIQDEYEPANYAMDLDEDGCMEYYAYASQFSKGTVGFHTYDKSGKISRVNKMYNNHEYISGLQTKGTSWIEDIIAVDYDKDGDSDAMLHIAPFAGYPYMVPLINEGNMNMTLDMNNEVPLRDYWHLPYYDFDNDGWYDYYSKKINRIFKNIAYFDYNIDTYPILVVGDESFDPDGVGLKWIKDYTGDGLIDLLEEKNQEIDKIKEYSLIVYRNNGDFTFVRQDTLFTISYDLNKYSNSEVDYFFNDFDNDGKYDVVYGLIDRSSRNRISVIQWGNGEKTMIHYLPEYGNVTIESKDVKMDYNNDGCYDLLATSDNPARKFIMLLKPDHTYQLIPINKDVLGEIGKTSEYGTTYFGMSPFITPNNTLQIGSLHIESHNSKPAAPTHLNAAQGPKGVMITWSHSQDAETPEIRMRYNISVKRKGKTGEGAYLISPCNSTKNGVHVPNTLPLIEGNRFFIPTASIPEGEYEVQVQGVDLHYLESDFSEVYDLAVRKSIAIDAPAATGVGIETKVTITSNVAANIDWDGGKAIDTIGNQYVVVWDSIGMKTITAGEHTHTIYVKPLPNATFVLPSEAMQLAIIHGEAQNAREGQWEISTNDGKAYIPFNKSDLIEMLSIDTASIVLRFNKTGRYMIRHTIVGEFGNGVHEQTIQITSEHIAPEISTVTNVNGHYQVTWQQPNDIPSEVIGYRLYKESLYADVYDLIAEVDKDSFMCIDVTSNPNVQSSRYALSYVTSYGESAKGTPHQGLHVMINRGVGTTWNLAWMKYEGRDIATYRIWRGTTPDNLSIIGEISGNMTSYSDLMTGDSINYYAVEVLFADNTPLSLPARRLAPQSSGISAMSNIISTASVNEVAFVEHIDVQGEDVIAGINNTSQLYAYIQPYYASYKAVNWVIIKGEDIAKISASGLLSVNGYTNGDVVVRAYALDGSNVYGETTINVRGFDDAFTITYIVDGETIKTEKLSHGSAIIAPESNKEGYHITWYNFPDFMPTHDIMVEGSYVISSYEITYIVDGEVYATDSMLYGTPIELIEGPEKEGYTFSGWSKVPSTMPAYDVVVNGSFTINSYNVIYMVDGAEYKRTPIVYGEPITLESEPTKEGHTFSGWSEAPTTMPAHDVVIEGSFIVNYYALTYIVDNEWYATDSMAYGDEIKLREEPIKEGYVFSGWSEAPLIMPAQDVEVVGTFTKSESIDDVLHKENNKAKKVLDDDKLYIILPNGTKYSATGKKI